MNANLNTDNETVVEKTVNTALANIDSGVLYEFLTRGETTLGIERLHGEESRAVVEQWYNGDMSDEWMVEHFAEHNEIVNTLVEIALADAQRQVTKKSEISGPMKGYLRGVEKQMRNLPGFLQEQFIARQIEDNKDLPYGRRGDYERAIGVLQFERRYSAYAEHRDKEKNLRERTNLWDELLKFTLYRTKVTYTVDGGKSSFNTEGWYENSTDAHNEAIRNIPSEGEYERAETEAVERYQPDSVNEPLSDVHEFIYYFG